MLLLVIRATKGGEVELERESVEHVGVAGIAATDAAGVEYSSARWRTSSSCLIETGLSGVSTS